MAMKIAVCYKSILGSTKKYASWLSATVHADMYDLNKANDLILSEYDLVIISSGTYFGRMPLVGFLKEHWKTLKNKKNIVVAVGAIPADSLESKKSYLLIPEEIREKITYFKLPAKSSLDKLQPVIEEVVRYI